MAPKTSLKPYKLKATDGPMTRDDLSSWEYNMQSFCRQTVAWQKFLPGGTRADWKASDADETNGLVVMKAEPNQAVEDEDKTNELRSAFKDFLTCVAIHCPTGFTTTVERESTSWKWIIKLVKETFNLNTRGEHFLAGNDIKLVYDENFTYQQGYMHWRDYYSSTLPEKGTMFKEKTLDEKDKISPLAELFIVEKWLRDIDERMPGHVQKTRGHLFTTQRPTLACNQRILCEQIDTMLAELNGASNTSNTGNVNVGFVPSHKPKYGGTPFPVQRGLRAGGFRGQGRAPTGPRQFRPAPQACQHCLEARRYDASTTHPTNKCNWMARKMQQQRPQFRQPNPGYKVLFVPNTPAIAGQPNQGQGGDQAAIINQLQAMSMDVQSQVYGETFQYPDSTGYDQTGYTAQYQYQHDDQYGEDYAGAAGYTPGSLEEL